MINPMQRILPSCGLRANWRNSSSVEELRRSRANGSDSSGGSVSASRYTFIVMRHLDLDETTHRSSAECCATSRAPLRLSEGTHPLMKRSLPDSSRQRIEQRLCAAGGAGREDVSFDSGN